MAMVNSFYTEGSVDLSTNPHLGSFATSDLPTTGVATGSTALDLTTREVKRYNGNAWIVVSIANGETPTSAGQVLDDRAGTSDPRAFIPYQGTDGGSSADAETARQGAYANIYQTMVDNIIPDVDFATAKSGDFINFHTVNQIQYINEFREGNPPAVYFDANGDRMTKAAAAAAPNTIALTAMRSNDGKKVYLLEQMQKTDIAQLSRTDQFRLADLESFPAYGTSIGLTPDDHNSGNARTDIINLIRTQTQMSETSPGVFEYDGLDHGPPDHNDYFTSQIDNLISRLDTMGVFSPTDILKQVKEIDTRFERALEFRRGKDRTESTPYGNQQLRGIIEVNKGGVLGGYNAFIEQERVISNIDNQRTQLANNLTVALPTAGGNNAVQRRLDVPMLIMLFQQYMNLTVEAKVAAETEEVRQQNLLLADYNRMQNIVNATLKQYDDTGDDAAEEKHGVSGSPTNSSVSADDRAIYMFEDALDNNPHPLESLRNISRPHHDTLHNSNNTENTFLKTQWEAFGTQLSDAVSLINQNTQIKMNDINSANRQKNRHFDLANNALRKMADTVQSIARAL